MKKPSENPFRPSEEQEKEWLEVLELAGTTTVRQTVESFRAKRDNTTIAVGTHPIKLGFVRHWLDSKDKTAGEEATLASEREAAEQAVISTRAAEAAERAAEAAARAAAAAEKQAEQAQRANRISLTAL